MKKHLLLYLLWSPTPHTFSMQQESPITKVFHDKNILNHIVQQVCIVNNGVLKDVHRDLASLRCTNKQLSDYYIPKGCDAKIIDIFNQSAPRSAYDIAWIACTLKFSSEIIPCKPIFPEFLKFFKSLASPNTITPSRYKFFDADLKKCSHFCYQALLNKVLQYRQFAAAKQLAELPTLILTKCDQSCFHSTSCLQSNCPIVIATGLLIGCPLDMDEKKVPSKEKALLDIITLLLKKHKFDPNHMFGNTTIYKKTILWEAIKAKQEELTELLMRNGADPYKPIVFLLGIDPLNVFEYYDKVAYVDITWAKNIYNKIQQEKAANQNNSLTN